MESGPLSAPEFKTFAKDVVLFCHITTNIPGEKYGDLLEQKGRDGVPYLAYLNAKGDVIGEPGDVTPEALSEGAKYAKTILELSENKEPTKAQRISLLMAEIYFGKITFAEAKKRKGAIKGLNLEEAKAISAAMVDLEVMAILEERQPRTPQAAAEVGKTFYEMLQAGTRPNKIQAFTPFFMMILRYGKSISDPDVFEAGLRPLVERYGHEDSSKRFFDAQQAELDRMRKAKQPAK